MGVAVAASLSSSSLIMNRSSNTLPSVSIPPCTSRQLLNDDTGRLICGDDFDPSSLSVVADVSCVGAWCVLSGKRAAQ